MNGVHDMGGMMNFGPVEEEADEPAFHADWERRVFGLTLAASATGAFNIDMGRRARESIPPADYLSSTYYEIWLAGLEKLLLETGLVSDDELSSGAARMPATPVKRVLKPQMVPSMLAVGSDSERPAATPARFAAGDPVITRNIHPMGHTRLPRYTRGKVWRDRASARGPCLRRFECARAWRGAAAALHRALHRSRAVGRGCGPDAHHVHRRLGQLP